MAEIPADEHLLVVGRKMDCVRREEQAGPGPEPEEEGTRRETPRTSPQRVGLADEAGERDEGRAEQGRPVQVRPEREDREDQEDAPRRRPAVGHEEPQNHDEERIRERLRSEDGCLRVIGDENRQADPRCCAR